MIIYLPKKLQPTGGTSTFARKFQVGMQKQGHAVVFLRPQKYDILLASPRAPLADLIYAKLHHIPIIHRLDGVFYPGTAAGHLWRLHNLPLRIIRNHFASKIIYQSQFSKQSCEKYLGSTTSSSTVIYNGVDTHQFTPQGPKANIRDNPEQHIFITVSRFRRLDQIIPIIKAFNTYHQIHSQNSKLIVIGNFEKEVAHIPNEYKGHADIFFLGTVSNAQLPSYLRAADTFVFTHKNPPCPNNVIEAMACGLPICGIADGAMAELVVNNQTGKLLPANERNAPDFPNQFAHNMHTCLQNQHDFSIRAITIAQAKYNLSVMLTKYEKVCKSVQDFSSSLHSP